MALAKQITQFRLRANGTNYDLNIQNMDFRWELERFTDESIALDGTVLNENVIAGKRLYVDVNYNQNIEPTTWDSMSDNIMDDFIYNGVGSVNFFPDASATSNNGPWNNTAPNSSVITLGGGGTNDTGNNHSMYCWAPVEGYSSFGKYSGNGSEDGPFVYTGFRPKFILTKAYSPNSNNNNEWNIRDTTRDPYNEASKVLAASNTNGTLDNAHTGIDILSNGFKLKGDTNGQSNYNGWDYLYCAFAENPFKYARAR